MKRAYSDRKTLVYMLAFSNYSYLGYPLIEFVYGAETLSKVLVFVIPFTIFIYTFGVKLITADLEKPKGKFKIQPAVPAIATRIALRLLGADLSGKSANFALAASGTILSAAKNCMSPISMIYTGRVLAKYSLKELSATPKAALIAAVRLILIPAIVVGGCLMFRLITGLYGVQYLLIPAVISAMLIGMNIVIFRGEEGAESAQACFYSLIFAIATIPILFTILAEIA